MWALHAMSHLIFKWTVSWWHCSLNHWTSASETASICPKAPICKPNDHFLALPTDSTVCLPSQYTEGFKHTLSRFEIGNRVLWKVYCLHLHHFPILWVVMYYLQLSGILQDKEEHFQFLCCRRLSSRKDAYVNRIICIFSSTKGISFILFQVVEV